jgi:hypothetical protein
MFVHKVDISSLIPSTVFGIEGITKQISTSDSADIRRPHGDHVYLIKDEDFLGVVPKVVVLAMADDSVLSFSYDVDQKDSVYPHDREVVPFHVSSICDDSPPMSSAIKSLIGEFSSTNFLPDSEFSNLSELGRVDVGPMKIPVFVFALELFGLDDSYETKGLSKIKSTDVLTEGYSIIFKAIFDRSSSSAELQAVDRSECLAVYRKIFSDSSGFSLSRRIRDRNECYIDLTTSCAPILILKNRPVRTGTRVFVWNSIYEDSPNRVVLSYDGEIVGWGFKVNSWLQFSVYEKVLFCPTYVPPSNLRQSLLSLNGYRCFGANVFDARSKTICAHAIVNETYL